MPIRRRRKAQKSSATRQVVTPEGVALNFQIADAYVRASAALIDALIVVTVPVLLVKLIQFVVPNGLTMAGATLFTLLFFLFRIGYYLVSELKWRGQTYGKYTQGIRVVGRNGQPLSAHAIIVRNITRDVEFWLPVTLLFGLYQVDSDIWQELIFLAWTLGLVVVPLLNRDRMRVGDFLAGTWVVVDTKARSWSQLKVLLKKTESLPTGAAASSTFNFTAAELSHYGEYELEVLAGVLRQTTPLSSEALREVAARICTKIGFENAPEDTTQSLVFLRAYYDALRDHLERQNLVKGVRPEDKYAVAEMTGAHKREQRSEKL